MDLFICFKTNINNLILDKASGSVSKFPILETTLQCI